MTTLLDHVPGVLTIFPVVKLAKGEFGILNALAPYALDHAVRSLK